MADLEASGEPLTMDLFLATGDESLRSAGQEITRVSGLSHEEFVAWVHAAFEEFIDHGADFTSGTAAMVRWLRAFTGNPEHHVILASDLRAMDLRGVVIVSVMLARGRELDWKRIWRRMEELDPGQSTAVTPRSLLGLSGA